jgi:hypothetical protein
MHRASFVNRVRKVRCKWETGNGDARQPDPAASSRAIPATTHEAGPRRGRYCDRMLGAAWLQRLSSC